MTTSTATVQARIEQLIAENPIMIFSKGTDMVPRCGFTMETKTFFENLGVKATFFDVLEDHEMRQALSEMTDWPTLPKVFIGGKFYGDTDILAPMAEKGELQPLIEAAVKA